MERVEERLIIQTQVDVDSNGRSIFARGRIVGVDLSDGGPHVNGVETLVGRAIEESEAGEPVVLLERNFGAFHELPETGRLELGGGVTAQYVGQAASPEYFVVIEETDFLAQANLPWCLPHWRRRRRWRTDREWLTTWCSRSRRAPIPTRSRPRSLPRWARAIPRWA